MTQNLATTSRYPNYLKIRHYKSPPHNRNDCVCLYNYIVLSLQFLTKILRLLKDFTKILRRTYSLQCEERHGLPVNLRILLLWEHRTISRLAYRPTE